MGLETGTYLDDLVATNPLGSDDRSTADDHLRLIKDLLLNTFPNINAAMNATPTELNLLVGLLAAAAEINILDGALLSTAELNILNGALLSTTELNYVDGVTSALQTQLNGKAATSHSHTLADISDSGSLAALNSVDTAQLAAAAVGRSEIANSTTTAAGAINSGNFLVFAFNDWALFPMISASSNRILVGAHTTDGSSAANPRMALYNDVGSNQTYDLDHRWILAA